MSATYIDLYRAFYLFQMPDIPLHGIQFIGLIDTG